MLARLFVITVFLTALAGTSLAATPAQSAANPRGALYGQFSGSFQGNFSIVTGAATTNATTSPATILSTITDTITGTPAAVFEILITYKYTSLFLLMLSDSSALPPPSEFIMPPAGFLAKIGYLNFGLAFLALMVANTIGITIDYYIGYHLGERFVLRHRRLFRMKKADVDTFQYLLNEQGPLIVFLGRLVPLLRIGVSFFAGFAKMPKKRYYALSISGAMIYNYLLMAFGYYLISESFAVSLVFVIGIVSVVGYLGYKLVYKRALIEGRQLMLKAKGGKLKQ